MMNRARLVPAAILIATGFAAAPLTCAATAQRTFVSALGSDANPCSLAAPCRGFAAAIAQTNPGGEIVVLDSAGYGSVTINKAVSIVVPPGTYAGLSVFAATDGIVVNAGATDEVILRGLTINNQGGNNGIVFNSGAALYVEGCTIRGFNGVGMANVKFVPGGASKLFVKDSYIRGGQAGISMANGTTAASATIDNTRIESNVTGVTATFSGALALRNSIVSENTSHGVNLQTGAGQIVDVALDNVLLSNNDSDGLHVAGSNITVAVSNSTVVGNINGVFVQGGSSAATGRLTNNVISRNATGILTGANGTILSPASNTIEGNGTDGVPGSYSAK